MEEIKTYWDQVGDKNISLWTKNDDRQKKKKITPKEPRSWKADMDNMREAMRKSCDKGSSMYPQ